MPKVYYGTDELNRGWEDYFERCNAIEVDIGRYEDEPKIETLNSWRVDSPQGFCFILHADRAIAEAFQDLAGPDDVEDVDLEAHFGEAWERTQERARALAATSILIRTPGSLTPGTANRRLMARFVDAFADRTDRAVLWEPSGLWTPGQTTEFADELGIVPTYDPFLAQREDVEFTHGDAGFLITERAAMRRQFDIFDFKRMLEWTHNYDRLFVMCRGRHKWTHSELIKAAVEQRR